MRLVRESIFSSVIRSFLMSFATVIGVAGAFLALLFLIGGLCCSGKNQDSFSSTLIVPESGGRKAVLKPNTPVILRLNIHGMIGVGEMRSEERR